MNLGAKPKQLAWLGGLVVTAVLTYYYNSDNTPPAAAPRTARVSALAPDADTVSPGASSPVPDRRRPGTQSAGEFKPRSGPKDPKDRADMTTIDPTIRWDLLAKVQNVEPGPPGRNLFQFGSTPPPPPMKALPIVKPIQIVRGTAEPSPPPPVDRGPTPAPPPPQITLKYYGYKISKSDGHKAAFLLDGEDILIAGENDTLKRHYRIVKIGVASITIEDTDFKSTQTLPLVENLAG